MKNESLIVEEVVGDVTVLTLNRPEKHNALTINMIEDLYRVLVAAEKRECRALIFQGDGPSFCSGLDLKEASDPALAEDASYSLARMLKALYGASCITVAAVHGATMAGGAALMSLCDFAVAAEDTRFAFPETQRGFVPAFVTAILLPQLAPRHVRELVLTGETIDAKRAYEMGWVNRVVPESAVRDGASKIVDQVLRGAPEAVRQTKKLIHELEPPVIQTGFQRALIFHQESRRSKEAREGATAFLEKRQAKFRHGSSHGNAG